MDKIFFRVLLDRALGVDPAPVDHQFAGRAMVIEGLLLDLPAVGQEMSENVRLDFGPPVSAPVGRPYFFRFRTGH